MIKDHPIFKESVSFIRSNLNKNNFSALENRVLERLIHTSGDFGIESLLEFSQDACELGIKSLQNGAPILTDTDMAAAGIKSMAKNTHGNSIFSAKEWIDDGYSLKLTKTAYGIENAWKDLSLKYLGIRSPIIVFGSSPTALDNLLDFLQTTKQKPSLIIGMPVGFIGVKQCKEKLLNTTYPRIVLNSTRGGAAMAAAAVNALLRESV